MAIVPAQGKLLIKKIKVGEGEVTDADKVVTPQNNQQKVAKGIVEACNMGWPYPQETIIFFPFYAADDIDNEYAFLDEAQVSWHEEA